MSPTGKDYEFYMPGVKGVFKYRKSNNVLENSLCTMNGLNKALYNAFMSKCLKVYGKPVTHLKALYPSHQHGFTN